MLVVALRTLPGDILISRQSATSQGQASSINRSSPFSVPNSNLVSRRNTRVAACSRRRCRLQTQVARLLRDFLAEDSTAFRQRYSIVA